MQTVIALSILAVAIAYLVIRFILPKKKKKNCGGNDCGC